MKQLLFLLFLLPLLAVGQIPNPMPNTYVNDFANVLEQVQILKLNEKISSIEKKSSVQIAVVIVNDLPPNMEIEEYSLGIGRSWHVGNANNGLVYVIAINKKQHRLEVSSKLEGDIPDISALNINIKPYYRNKDYYGGINYFLDDIGKQLDPVLREQLKLAEIERKKKDDKIKDNFNTFLFWVLGIGLVLSLVGLYFNKRNKRLKKLKEEEERRQAELRRKATAPLRPEYNATPFMVYPGRATRDIKTPKEKEDDSSLAALIPLTTIFSDDEDRDSKGNNDDDDSYRPNNDNNNDNDFGNWGKDSSDDDSTSGFQGAGATENW